MASAPVTFPPNPPGPQAGCRASFPLYLLVSTQPGAPAQRAEVLTPRGRLQSAAGSCSAFAPDLLWALSPRGTCQLPAGLLFFGAQESWVESPKQCLQGCVCL